MTLEEKQLLLKDLCGRLPYGVMCVFSEPPYGEITEPLKMGGLRAFIEDKWKVKPYLRPMSSMTEEESEELEDVCGQAVYSFGSKIYDKTPEFYDWLNEHHFDYHGLIEKGLALEAPEGMYKEEQP